MSQDTEPPLPAEIPITFDEDGSKLSVSLDVIRKWKRIMPTLPNISRTNPGMYIGEGTAFHMKALVTYYELGDTDKWDLSLLPEDATSDQVKIMYPVLHDYFENIKSNESLRSLAQLGVTVGYQDFSDKCIFFYKMRTGMTLIPLV